MEKKRFVLFFSSRFVTIFNEKSAIVNENHQDVQRLLEQIRYQHETASKLEKELQHEKTVLDERLKVFIYLFIYFSLKYLIF
jgi:hypothetical protein